MQVGTNVFLIITLLAEELIEFIKSLFDPGHEFFLHDVTGDTHVGEVFVVSFY